MENKIDKQKILFAISLIVLVVLLAMVVTANDNYFTIFPKAFNVL